MNEEPSDERIETVWPPSVLRPGSTPTSPSRHSAYAAQASLVLACVSVLIAANFHTASEFTIYFLTMDVDGTVSAAFWLASAIGAVLSFSIGIINRSQRTARIAIAMSTLVAVLHIWLFYASDHQTWHW